MLPAKRSPSPSKKPISSRRPARVGAAAPARAQVTRSSTSERVEPTATSTSVPIIDKRPIASRPAGQRPVGLRPLAIPAVMLPVARAARPDAANAAAPVSPRARASLPVSAPDNTASAVSKAPGVPTTSAASDSPRVEIPPVRIVAPVFHSAPNTTPPTAPRARLLPTAPILPAPAGLPPSNVRVSIAKAPPPPTLPAVASPVYPAVAVLPAGARAAGTSPVVAQSTSSLQTLPTAATRSAVFGAATFDQPTHAAGIWRRPVTLFTAAAVAAVLVILGGIGVVAATRPVTLAEANTDAPGGGDPAAIQPQPVDESAESPILAQPEQPLVTPVTPSFPPTTITNPNPNPNTGRGPLRPGVPTPRPSVFNAPSPVAGTVTPPPSSTPAGPFTNPTPDPSPGPTPDPTPDPTPTPDPSPSPTPDPIPTPDPSPSPTPDPSPSPTPDPLPTLAPDPPVVDPPIEPPVGP